MGDTCEWTVTQQAPDPSRIRPSPEPTQPTLWGLDGQHTCLGPVFSTISGNRERLPAWSVVMRVTGVPAHTSYMVLPPSSPPLGSRVEQREACHVAGHQSPVAWPCFILGHMMSPH